MSPDELLGLGRALELLGPYGVVGVALIAIRRVYRDLKAVHERVLALTEQQTAVMARVDASLRALHDAMLIANARMGGPTGEANARIGGDKVAGVVSGRPG